MSMMHAQRGLTVMLVLAFMGVMLVVLGTITSYTLQQTKYGRALQAREQAVNIAEAGLEYYRWFLARNPSILTNGGAGLVSPYTHTVNDPQGGTIGSATVTATAALQCGQVQWIDISSRGVANADTRFPRTVSARYMKRSVAEYSYIVNGSVHAGSDRNIKGPYFSNGGIRMDGTNNSDVLSATTTWNCTSGYGCDPSQSSAPGVVGSGSGYALWRWGSTVPAISFTAMATNFETLRGYAQSYGIYLSGTATYVGNVQQGGTYSSVSGDDTKGYHLVFNSNGTVTVYRVTATTGVPSYTAVDSWYTDYGTIASQTLLGTYAVPSNCSLIYSKAKTWVEGIVSGKITVLAADSGSFAPDVVLTGNITYNTNDGSSGLTAIAERSTKIPLVAPDYMEIHGIFVSQSGQHVRPFFSNDPTYCYSSCVGSGYAQYAFRSQLTTHGTVVSLERTGTAWADGQTVISGFLQRYDYYDQLLAFAPPPFTPTATSTYGMRLWLEQ